MKPKKIKKSRKSQKFEVEVSLKNVKLEFNVPAKINSEIRAMPKLGNAGLKATSTANCDIPTKLNFQDSVGNSEVTTKSKLKNVGSNGHFKANSEVLPSSLFKNASLKDMSKVDFKACAKEFKSILLDEVFLANSKNPANSKENNSNMDVQIQIVSTVVDGLVDAISKAYVWGPTKSKCKCDDACTGRSLKENFEFQDKSKVDYPKKKSKKKINSHHFRKSTETQKDAEPIDNFMKPESTKCLLESQNKQSDADCPANKSQNMRESTGRSSKSRSILNSVECISKSQNKQSHANCPSNKSENMRKSTCRSSKSRSNLDSVERISESQNTAKSIVSSMELPINLNSEDSIRGSIDCSLESQDKQKLVDSPLRLQSIPESIDGLLGSSNNPEFIACVTGTRNNLEFADSSNSKSMPYSDDCLLELQDDSEFVCSRKLQCIQESIDCTQNIPEFADCFLYSQDNPKVTDLPLEIEMMPESANCLLELHNDPEFLDCSSELRCVPEYNNCLLITQYNPGFVDSSLNLQSFYLRTPESVDCFMGLRNNLEFIDSSSEFIKMPECVDYLLESQNIPEPYSMNSPNSQSNPESVNYLLESQNNAERINRFLELESVPEFVDYSLEWQNIPELYSMSSLDTHRDPESVDCLLDSQTGAELYSMNSPDSQSNSGSVDSLLDFQSIPEYINCSSELESVPKFVDCLLETQNSPELYSLNSLDLQMNPESVDCWLDFQNNPECINCSPELESVPKSVDCLLGSQVNQSMPEYVDCSLGLQNHPEIESVPKSVDCLLGSQINQNMPEYVDCSLGLQNHPEIESVPKSVDCLLGSQINQSMPENVDCSLGLQNHPEMVDSTLAFNNHSEWVNRALEFKNHADCANCTLESHNYQEQLYCTMESENCPFNTSSELQNIPEFISCSLESQNYLEVGENYGEYQDEYTSGFEYYPESGDFHFAFNLRNENATKVIYNEADANISEKGNSENKNTLKFYYQNKNIREEFPNYGLSQNDRYFADKTELTEAVTEIVNLRHQIDVIYAELYYENLYATSLESELYDSKIEISELREKIERMGITNYNSDWFEHVLSLENQIKELKREKRAYLRAQIEHQDFGNERRKFWEWVKTLEEEIRRSKEDILKLRNIILEREDADAFDGYEWRKPMLDCVCALKSKADILKSEITKLRIQLEELDVSNNVDLVNYVKYFEDKAKAYKLEVANLRAQLARKDSELLNSNNRVAALENEIENFKMGIRNSRTCEQPEVIFPSREELKNLKSEALSVLAQIEQLNSLYCEANLEETINSQNESIPLDSLEDNNIIENNYRRNLPYSPGNPVENKRIAEIWGPRAETEKQNPSYAHNPFGNERLASIWGPHTEYAKKMFANARSNSLENERTAKMRSQQTKTDMSNLPYCPGDPIENERIAKIWGGRRNLSSSPKNPFDVERGAKMWSPQPVSEKRDLNCACFCGDSLRNETVPEISSPLIDPENQNTRYSFRNSMDKIKSNYDYSQTDPILENVSIRRFCPSCHYARMRSSGDIGVAIYVELTQVTNVYWVNADPNYKSQVHPSNMYQNFENPYGGNAFFPSYPSSYNTFVTSDVQEKMFVDCGNSRFYDGYCCGIFENTANPPSTRSYSGLEIQDPESELLTQMYAKSVSYKNLLH